LGDAVPAPKKTVPADTVLIYVPGLEKTAANTGEAVADVIAASLDRTRPGKYRAATTKGAAPRGLRVSKGVLGPGDKPVLDVFELDYLSRMERADSAPAGSTGAIISAALTLRAFGKLFPAYFRGAKNKRAKIQLTLAIVATLALTFSTLVAVGALAGAAGWLDWLPKGVRNLGWTDSNAGRVATQVTGGTAVAWLAARRWLLAVAHDVRQALRYLNADRHRDTVTQTLDDAIDGLLDSDWTGTIHVLGYSFGSLVALDALFRVDDDASPADDRVRDGVSSLTTIGCPVDAVRLFYPTYFAGRRSRVKGLPWRNVFIPADVFGSNLNDKDDLADGSPASAHLFPGAKVTCVRYTDDRLSLFNVFALTGFRMHGGYWGTPDEASCFDKLAGAWVPIDVVDAVPPQRAKVGARKGS
jgi:hypothetical protein